MAHRRRLVPLITALLAAAVLAGLVAGSSGPAYAGRTTEVDARGDAPAPWDVTKVDFSYDGRGAHARVHVADLQPEGELVFAVTNRSQSLRFGLAATGHADGSRTSTFYRYRDGALSEHACRGSRVRWSVTKDVATLSFPQQCFRALGRKVVFAVGSTRDFPDGQTVDQGPASVLRAPSHHGR